MSETTTKQLTSEELQTIQDLQTQYNKFVFELGNVEAQLQGLAKTKSLLETEKDNIVSDINKLGEREKELVTTLQEKYGTGNINPQTGEITPL
jgi:chromosome segregation ATPase